MLSYVSTAFTNTPAKPTFLPSGSRYSSWICLKVISWTFSVTPQTIATIYTSTQSCPSNTHLSLGSSGRRPCKVDQVLYLSKSYVLQINLGDPKAFPAQIAYVYSPHPACSGSSPGSSPSWICPDFAHREAVGRHPNQMPEQPQLGLYVMERGGHINYELFPVIWAPHLVPKGEPRCAMKVTHFSCPTAQS